MTSADFYRVSLLVRAADSYMDVFQSGDTVAIKKTYRSLIRYVHPDVVSASEKEQADELTEKLVRYYEQALKALAAGTFGEPIANAVFQTRFMTHHALRKLTNWCDMTTCYQAVSSDQAGKDHASFVKVARRRIDNDLLGAEARALTWLWSGDPKRSMFFPKLIESFGVVSATNRVRANALQWCDGFVNLEEVRAAYQDGVDPLDMAWMWRRILWALDYAHDCGLVHGAPLPQNILIHPAMHGVILADWCYSVQKRSSSYQPLTAVVGRQRDWYPAEVLAKAPFEPRHDIVMAARSMVWLMGGDSVTAVLPDTVPSPMRTYFASIITGKVDLSDGVPPVAVAFDELLRRLGAPYYPRTFRSFSLNP